MPVGWGQALQGGRDRPNTKVKPTSGGEVPTRHWPWLQDPEAGRQGRDFLKDKLNEGINAPGHYGRHSPR